MANDFEDGPGGMRIRRNTRIFSDLKNQVMSKIPRNIGANELNVSLGAGTQTLAGAGPFSLSVTAPRDLILRDLVISAGTVDGTVTAIIVQGDAVHQGAAAPLALYSAGNQDRPDFSLPVMGGTTVQVSGTLAAAGTVSAGFAID